MVKRSFNLTTTRRSILLNVVLLFIATGLSELVLRGFFGEPYTGAFVGGFFSSIVLRIIFAHENPRKFKNKKTITAANGKVFSKKHEYIVNAIIFGSIAVSWAVTLSFKEFFTHEYLMLPPLIIFAFFQVSVKSTLFILDLPIGTFNVDQRKVKAPSSGSSPTSYRSNSDQYFSPGYSHLSSNIHHR